MNLDFQAETDDMTLHSKLFLDDRQQHRCAVSAFVRPQCLQGDSPPNRADDRESTSVSTASPKSSGICV